ncbi:MAG: HEAT repeat domain-containing protein, partial [Roseiflexaceae bacterium]
DKKRFDPDLLTKLAKEATQDATYLPLLQVTLEDLWERGSLRNSAFGTLADAIRDRADAVCDFVDYDGGKRKQRAKAEQNEIIEIFLELVKVSPNDDPRRDVRQRRSLRALTQDKPLRAHLIEDLCRARLLIKRLEGQSGEIVEAVDIEEQPSKAIEVVDIIHESLITNWTRLQRAITEQREVMKQRDRFMQALADWRADGFPITPERLQMFYSQRKLLGGLDKEVMVCLLLSAAWHNFDVSEWVRLADQPVVEYIIMLLTSNKREKRLQAAKALSAFHWKQSIPMLISSLKIESDLEVRSQLITALQHIGTTAAAPLVAELQSLAYNDEFVKSAAIG